jgi:hypothetical protein
MFVWVFFMLKSSSCILINQFRGEAFYLVDSQQEVFGLGVLGYPNDCTSQRQKCFETLRHPPHLAPNPVQAAYCAYSNDSPT